MSHPTRALPQSKEALLRSYNKKLKDDIKSMVENFKEIIKLARLITNNSSKKNAEITEFPNLGVTKKKTQQKRTYTSSVEEDTQISRMTQAEQDQYEMQVRAANIVRAGESLMKLVSDLKQFLILNDFPSVNEFIGQKTKLYKQKQSELDNKLLALRDDMATELFELEDEYYSCVYK